MTSQSHWNRTIAAGIFVGLLLFVEHLLFYKEDDFKKEPELVLLGSNVLGTITIAAGVALAARDPEEAPRHITIAAIGGSLVVFLRIARRTLRHSYEFRTLADQAIGQVLGARTYGRAYRNAADAADRN